MYMEVQLDRTLGFRKHLQVATVKDIQCGADLALFTPNIGVHLKTMLSRKNCLRYREVWCRE